MNNSNPFQLVMSGLWDCLLAHSGFERDVKQQNRIRFDDPNNRDPLKGQTGQGITASDLPEVCIIPESFISNLQATSSTTSITRTLSILLSSGDYRYSEILGKLEWQVFVALLAWKTRLATLQWKDKNFVKRVNIVSQNSGLSDPQANRNIAGWSATWRVEVEMHFSTLDLQNELPTSDRVN